jgi:hypothetical protein
MNIYSILVEAYNLGYKQGVANTHAEYQKTKMLSDLEKYITEMTSESKTKEKENDTN